MTTLHPLRDFLVIKQDEAAQPSTAAGIITEVQKEDQRTRGVVVSKGPGVTREGKFVKTEIEVGTHIVFRDSFLLQREKIDGEEFIMMPETEVIGVLL